MGRALSYLPSHSPITDACLPSSLPDHTPPARAAPFSFLQSGWSTLDVTAQQARDDTTGGASGHGRSATLDIETIEAQTGKLGPFAIRMLLAFQQGREIGLVERDPVRGRRAVARKQATELDQSLDLRGVPQVIGAAEDFGGDVVPDVPGIAREGHNMASNQTIVIQHAFPAAVTGPEFAHATLGGNDLGAGERDEVGSEAAQVVGRSGRETGLGK